jgi:hypothetical protein
VIEYDINRNTNKSSNYWYFTEFCHILSQVAVIFLRYDGEGLTGFNTAKKMKENNSNLNSKIFRIRTLDPI